MDEERRWLELAKSLDGFGRIFYRRRLWNEAKKSGNVRDFLNALGNRYRYFIVFDADSLMSGETILKLVKLMGRRTRMWVLFKLLLLSLTLNPFLGAYINLPTGFMRPFLARD